jgi:hypothetical protein
LPVHAPRRRRGRGEGRRGPAAAGIRVFPWSPRGDDTGGGGVIMPTFRDDSNLFRVRFVEITLNIRKKSNSF